MPTDPRDAQIAALREALESVQWAGQFDGKVHCPACNGTIIGGHRDDCRIMVALAAAPAAKHQTGEIQGTRQEHATACPYRDGDTVCNCEVGKRPPRPTDAERIQQLQAEVEQLRQEPIRLRIAIEQMESAYLLASGERDTLRQRCEALEAALKGRE